jgi:hypothetical protein
MKSPKQEQLKWQAGVIEEDTIIAFDKIKTDENYYRNKIGKKYASDTNTSHA